MTFTLQIAVVLILCFVKQARNHLQPYIIGGSSAKIQRFPHAVFLAIECDETHWICGSSVISQGILLTAAHCVHTCEKVGKWKVYALAGHENLQKTSVGRRINKIIAHKHYDAELVRNDIALVRLHLDLPLGRNIKKVIINNGIAKKTQDAYVAGWGVLDEKGEKDTDVLKYVVQRLKPKTECKRIRYLYTGMMCAEGIHKKERPAYGDSGSALIIADVIQIGVVSFIDPKFPNLVVYTNLSYYHDWIVKHTRKLYCL